MSVTKFVGPLTLCVALVAGCGSAPSRTEVPAQEEASSSTEAVDPDGRTALMLAAFDGHTETLRLLLERGARVDARDGFGRTALMYAASGPHHESVRLLLDWKADPLAADHEERFTALMFAAAEGHADVVRTLLEHGSDPNQVDVDNDTALDFAARNGHEEVVRLLNRDHDAKGSHDTHAVHWGYGQDNGPDRWSSMNTDWAICINGTAQSPIDVHDAQDSSVLASMALDLPEASVRVVRQKHVLHALNTGHTIQVNVDAGDTLTIGDQSFDLQQYHFHSPSEHTVSGEHYPMEMHLVHMSSAGELAVVGVFIEEGEHNAAFEPVWSNMPTEPGTETRIEHVRVNIDDMLPSDTASWRYHGSLTTPPCTEAVRWIVLKTPIQLDAAQVKQFQSVFTGNNRPTQPLNGRSVVTDSLVVR